jgi:hypothetical protein
MPRADIETRSGTKISIEGTTEEISKIIGDLERREQHMAFRFERKKEIKKEERRNMETRQTLTDSVIKLKEENFFNQPRSLKDVQEFLRARGMIYPTTTLSGVLINLIRRGELGRIREEDLWKYVKR